MSLDSESLELGLFCFGSSFSLFLFYLTSEISVLTLQQTVGYSLSSQYFRYSIYHYLKCYFLPTVPDTHCLFYFQQISSEYETHISPHFTLFYIQYKTQIKTRTNANFIIRAISCFSKNYITFYPIMPLI